MTKVNKDKKTVCIAFPVWTAEGLKEFADTQGISMTAAVNIAVNEYLKKNHVDVTRFKDVHEYETLYGNRP